MIKAVVFADARVQTLDSLAELQEALGRLIRG